VYVERDYLVVGERPLRQIDLTSFEEKRYAEKEGGTLQQAVKGSSIGIWGRSILKSRKKDVRCLTTEIGKLSGSTFLIMGSAQGGGKWEEKKDRVAVPEEGHLVQDQTTIIFRSSCLRGGKVTSEPGEQGETKARSFIYHMKNGNIFLGVNAKKNQWTPDFYQ